MTNDVIKKKRFPGSGSDFGGLTRGFRLTRVSRPLVLFLIQSAGFLNRKAKSLIEIKGINDSRKSLYHQLMTKADVRKRKNYSRLTYLPTSSMEETTLIASRVW